MWFKTTLLLFIVVVVSGQDPVVQTSQGRVRGYVDTSDDGDTFNAFLSIPYGAPPVGSLRFMPPQPAKPWSHLLDGTQPVPWCLQDNYLEGAGIVGQEDCLVLNVYTRSLQGTKKLPVMVYIHGGAYVVGSSSPDLYSPVVLLNHEIVLVTLNYRLGPFGFLATGDEVIQGNMALKDQTLALRWVKDNIAAFGGDPNKVTIFGESAGGVSVHYHLLSPLSRGLFHQAITQSGSTFYPWAFMEPEEIRDRSKRFASYLKCPTGNSAAMLSCMQEVNAHDIALTIKNASDWMVFPVAPFAPTREVAGDNRFMTKRPREVVAAGEVADVPWMTGINEHEGEFIAAGIWKHGMLDDMNKNTVKAFEILFSYKYNAKDPEKLTRDLRKYYFGDEDISEASMEMLIQIVSDVIFKFPSLETALAHRPHVKSPIYFYELTYMGAFSFSQNTGPLGGGPEYRPTGTSHADDLFYLFKPPMAFGIGTSEAMMAERMTAWWTNFADTGNPTPRGAEASEIVWEPLKTNEVNYFEISSTPSMQKDILDKKRLSFLEGMQSYMKWSLPNGAGILASCFSLLFLMHPEAMEVGWHYD